MAGAPGEVQYFLVAIASIISLVVIGSLASASTFAAASSALILPSRAGAFAFRPLVAFGGTAVVPVLACFSLLVFAIVVSRCSDSRRPEIPTVGIVGQQDSSYARFRETSRELCCVFSGFSGANMDGEPLRIPLSPTAMPPADVAKLLSRAGGTPVTAEMLQADLSAGAPVNKDGTLNLVHYAAWLVREMNRGD